MRALLAAFTLAIAIVALASPARAHGMRTAYLEIVESAPGAAIATWRTTALDPLASPRFPAGCEAEPSGEASPLARTFLLRCDGPIAGRAVGVTGLGPISTEAVVRVSQADGATLSAVLTPERAEIVVPRRSTQLGTLRAYVALGVGHIATGPDHLIFLLLLVLYLRRARAVIAAETAFTVSHSLSFSATALGLVRVSSAAAEVCIALSLVLLAGEVARRREAPPRLAAGAASALIFGLVHGLGFAGGLTEIGVPEGAAASALLGFGLGVEIGQVVFLAAALLVLAAISRRVRPAGLALGGAYAFGAAGAFWLCERLWTCFA
jgi:HupE / UreJ protein